MGTIVAGPLEQFVVKPLIPLQLGPYDISFTNSSFMMVTAVVISALLFTLAVKPGALIPSRLQVVSESLYEFVASMVKEQIGPEGRRYFPFVFSLFMLILFGNLLGMVPLGDLSFTFTSHIIVTFALALVVFLMVTILGFVRHGVHFLSIFVPGGSPVWLWPIIIPIEVLSYLSRPISLSMRLFANMLAGHITLKVIAGFSVMMVGAGALGAVGSIVPLVINVALTGFEFMVAVLQAYIFTILTCIYLKDTVELHH
jgi:F-type H+-transporting ATPase subunit a